MYKSLPPAFSFLLNETAPKILVEALKDYGLHEVAGPGNNPRIMQWAAQANATSYYKADSVPHCGLGMTAWVLQAGYTPPRDPLAAKNWALFGYEVPIEDAMLGDILVMERPGGNHVTMYVGQKGSIYYGLGANQNDEVNIAGFEISRITHVRRCPWKVGQPANVRKIILGQHTAAVAHGTSEA